MVTDICTDPPRLHNLDRDQSRQSEFICMYLIPTLYAIISHFHIHHPIYAPIPCREHFQSRSIILHISFGIAITA